MSENAGVLPEGDVRHARGGNMAEQRTQETRHSGGYSENLYYRQPPPEYARTTLPPLNTMDVKQSSDVETSPRSHPGADAFAPTRISHSPQTPAPTVPSWVSSPTTQSPTTYVQRNPNMSNVGHAPYRFDQRNHHQELRYTSPETVYQSSQPRPGFTNYGSYMPPSRSISPSAPSSSTGPRGYIPFDTRQSNSHPHHPAHLDSHHPPLPVHPEPAYEGQPGFPHPVSHQPSYPLSSGYPSGTYRHHSAASSASPRPEHHQRIPSLNDGAVASQPSSADSRHFSNDYFHGAAHEREEQAAGTLANMPRTPMSPTFAANKQPGQNAIGRTADGQPLVPGQRMLDERTTDAMSMMRRGVLPPPFPTAPSGADQRPKPPHAIPDLPARDYKCNGKTGMGEEHDPRYWPEPPPAQRSKRTLEAQHYVTPGASPDAMEVSASKKPDAKPAPKLKEESKKEAPEFQFVGQGDKNAPKIVRRHVMKRHRAQQRQTREEENRASGHGTELQTGKGTKKSVAKKRSHKKLKSEPNESSEGITVIDTIKANTETIAPALKTATTAELSRNAASHGTIPEPKANLTPPDTAKSSASSSRKNSYKDWDNFRSDSDSDRDGDSPDGTIEYSDPRAAVGPTVPDPFNRGLSSLMASGIRISGVDPKKLWYHFQTIMPSLMDEAVTGYAFNRIGWLYSTVSILDPEPVACVLGYTASHVASLHSQKNPEWSFACKARAIRLINERLQDPNEQASDGNIGAVLLLIFFEFIFCNPKEAALHLEGVRLMIQSRPGGYLSIIPNSALRIAVLRAEIIRSYLTISEHRFYVWKPLKKLPDFVVEVGPSAYQKDNSLTAFENIYCSHGLRLINRLEAVLLRLDNIAKSGVDLDVSGIRRIIAVAIRGCLDLDEDPESPWDCHISRKVLRLAAIVQIDLVAKEMFDTGPGRAKSKTFVRRIAQNHLGSKSDPEKANAWGRSIEMVIYVFLMANEPLRDKPWRGFYFAEALILTSKLTFNQWKEVEAWMNSYINNWGWTDAEESRHSREYFNLQATAKEFLSSWEEYVRQSRRSVMTE